MNKEILNHINKGQVFAIIPARSGSKGIRDKNIKLLGGYPLIAYSIAAAKLTQSIERVIVSTDSEKYAEISIKYGAEAPFLRPAELASDTATDIDFMRHVITWLYEHEGSVPEYWVHLRPTCPLRKPEIIDNAINNFESIKDATCLLSVCCPTNILTPYKWLKLDGQYLKSIIFHTVDEANYPRQSYPEAYMRTVYSDILMSETIINDSLFGDHVVPFITEFTNDIDDIQSFNECENLLKDNSYICLLDYLNKKSRGTA